MGWTPGNFDAQHPGLVSWDNSPWLVALYKVAELTRVTMISYQLQTGNANLQVESNNQQWAITSGFAIWVWVSRCLKALGAPHLCSQHNHQQSPVRSKWSSPINSGLSFVEHIWYLHSLFVSQWFVIVNEYLDWCLMIVHNGWCVIINHWFMMHNDWLMKNEFWLQTNSRLDLVDWWSLMIG